MLFMDMSFSKFLEPLFRQDIVLLSRELEHESGYDYDLKYRVRSFENNGSWNSLHSQICVNFNRYLQNSQRSRKKQYVGSSISNLKKVYE